MTSGVAPLEYKTPVRLLWVLNNQSWDLKLFLPRDEIFGHSQNPSVDALVLQKCWVRGSFSSRVDRFMLMLNYDRKVISAGCRLI